jgi:hypothetical protein
MLDTQAFAQKCAAIKCAVSSNMKREDGHNGSPQPEMVPRGAHVCVRKRRDQLFLYDRRQFLAIFLNASKRLKDQERRHSALQFTLAQRIALMFFQSNIILTKDRKASSISDTSVGSSLGTALPLPSSSASRLCSSL